MGKVITGREGPVLGISSSQDLFEKLRHESRKLEDGWHPYDAFNFLVTAWHLFHDWKKCEAPSALSRQKRHENKLPPSMIMVLDTVRDLVNGSKHFQLNLESASKRRVEEVHTGAEVGWYQYFFHEDVAGVTVDVHWYFSIRTLHNFLMAYFEWVFDDSTPVKSFPVELDEAISYCNIATRSGKKPNALYLKGVETAWGKKHASKA
jgi:hypothetical protein